MTTWADVAWHLPGHQRQGYKCATQYLRDPTSQLDPSISRNRQAVMSLFPQQPECSTTRLKTTALLVTDSVSLWLEEGLLPSSFLSVISFWCWFPDSKYLVQKTWQTLSNVISLMQSSSVFSLSSLNNENQSWAHQKTGKSWAWTSSKLIYSALSLSLFLLNI